MEYLWIFSSIAAAFFQSMRLGALKQLNQTLSVTATSYVRVLFTLPFLAIYLLGVYLATGEPVPAPGAKFLICTCIAALGQFVGTVALVRLFQMGNFAVGTMLQKTDVLMTAVIGSLFFSEMISAGGWLAILVTAAGVLLISAGRLPAAAGPIARSDLSEMLFGPSTRIGLLTGLLFGLSYLFLREAILALDPGASALMRSAFAGFAMTTWSFLIVGVWFLLFERQALRKIHGFYGLCTFLGLTSALGTIFWFFASALANAAYVAAVAQVQIVFTLAISWFYFGERIGKIELAGMIIVLAGLVLFRAV
ncbi:MAG: EamA family transporter [Hyphomicrobiaceae bacterium]